MLFNSLEFAIFLPIVFVLYWFVFRLIKVQNVFLVITSYFFYAFWDWRFLYLIIISTCVDFIIGIFLRKEKKLINRKLLLFISLAINLGMLGVFKYYNFFIENFITAFSFFGREFSLSTLQLILPIGISFYTFQTLSYTIDIYNKKIEPTTNFVTFAAFVSFFPQLVAGPIERAKNLLPQFIDKRIFNYNKATDGLRQILWGFFKKMVIADNCAPFVDEFFANYHNYSGSALLLGAFLFSFLIYCDFSGYTDIAIGTSRLFGFDLKKNFNFPYFSRNIAEFWRRWHISLSTWFRDYLYIPLGGSKGSNYKTIRNIFIVFIISAFWHGANWTFIAWGIIHALLFIPLLLTNTNRKYLDIVSSNRKFPSIKSLVSIIITFILTTLAWVFFRAKDMSSAIGYFNQMFSETLFDLPEFKDKSSIITIIIFIIFLLLIEWKARKDNHALEALISRWKKPYRWLFYYSLVFVIFYFYGKQQQFIYFQF